MAMQSPPKLHEDCLRRYAEVKVSGAPIRAVVMRLTADEREIIVDEVINSSDAYSTFVKAFPGNDIRWAVLRMEYTTSSGGKRDKLAFVTWSPDSLTRPTMRESVRVKSSAVSMVGPMKKELDGISCFVQANDFDDLEASNILERVSKHERDAVAPDSLAAILQGTQ